MMMDCSKTEQLLSRYYDNELEGQERTAVSQHLAACARCARRAEEFRSLSEMVQRLPDPVPPAGLWARIEAALDQPSLAPPTPIPMPSRARRVLRARWLAAALMLLAFGLTLGGLWRWHHGPAGDGMASFAPYLKTFAESPDRAQQVLLARHEGERLDIGDIPRRVAYHPVAVQKPPEGFVVDSVYLVKLACCTCVETICRGSDGQTLVFFEHSRPDCHCFGHHGVTCQCAGKPTQIVAHAGYLAATWRVDGRSVTAVGVRDLTQLVQLVDHFSQTETQRES
ncbi:MAG: anti-sigma factor [Planctomycetes bacterium]|nr:anti-sigma factor [Planctomycetota bacterium]